MSEGGTLDTFSKWVVRTFDTRDIISILVILTEAYVVITGVNVPDAWHSIVLAVVAFWFGSRSNGRARSE